MPRSRLLKPRVLQDYKVAGIAGGCGNLNLICGILVRDLPSIADREGRLTGVPQLVWSALLALFPQVGVGDVDLALNALHRVGELLRYEIDGQPYIQLLHFAEDQNPHQNERKSEIPPPELGNGAGETPLLPLGLGAKCTVHVDDISPTFPAVIPLSRYPSNPPPLVPPPDDDDDEADPRTRPPGFLRYRRAWVHPEDLDQFGPAPNSDHPDPAPGWEDFLALARVSPGTRFEHHNPQAAELRGRNREVS